MWTTQVSSVEVRAGAEQASPAACLLLESEHMTALSYPKAIICWAQAALAVMTACHLNLQRRSKGWDPIVCLSMCTQQQ